MGHLLLTNLNCDMLIKKCDVIQKTATDIKSNQVLITLGIVCVTLEILDSEEFVTQRSNQNC